jgi:hypothetical protein
MVAPCRPLVESDMKMRYIIYKGNVSSVWLHSGALKLFGEIDIKSIANQLTRELHVV